MNSHRPRGSKGQRFVLSPELLEDRTVPAGNVTAFVENGVLHIWGDSADNRIWVSGAGKDTAVIVTLDGTTLNGGRTPLWFDGIKFAYDIQLHDGNDFLYVSGLDGSAGLFVNMGDGNDGLAADRLALDGANVLYTGAGNDTVSVGGGKMKWAAFDVGAGNDRLFIVGTEFGDVVFAGGEGSDSLGLVSIQWHSFPGTSGFESVFSSLMPVANNDVANVGHGKSVTVNVLANDKAIVGILDPSTVQITSQPKHGTVKVNDDGSVTYTSDSSSNATRDSFRYTVRSSTGAVSNEATVTLNIPDKTAPTPTITTTASDPTNQSPIPFKVTFSEKVTGFEAADVSVTNGTVGNFTPVDNKTFTFDVTPTADGSVSVSLAAGAAKDAAGNDSTAATKSITFDQTGPSTTISSSASNPTNLDQIPITVTFSEDVTGFTQSDVVVTNGTVSGFTTVNTHTYTFNIAPTANGTITVDVAGGVANDTAGNPNTAATQFTIVSDTGAPSVTLSTTATSPTSLSPIPFTATFSEDVTGFALGDITVTNGTAGNFVAVDGHTYTFDVTPTADGAVTVSVAAGVATDSGGNDNTASAPVTITSDTTAPTATVSSNESGTTSVNPIPYTVTFSEDVTGFTSGDVLVTNGSVTNFVAVNGTTYTFDVVPSGNNVQIDVSVPAGVAEDAATNGNAASNTLSMTFSGTTVSTTITTTATDPTNLSPIPFTVTFGEDVTGFDVSDINVTNGTPGNFVAVDGHTYTFDVTPTADGPVVVNVAAGGATGTVSNAPTSAAQFTITSDTTQPTAMLSTSATSPTNDSPIQFTLTFSEDVTGLTIGEINVTNGTASNLQGSGTTYTFDVTPAGDGDVTVSVAAGVAQDAAGNDNTAATPVAIISDTTSPVVTNNTASTGAITGTSSDASGVTGVKVSISDGTNFWSGTAFDSASEVFFDATSSDNFATWSLAFTQTGTFTVHSVATDAAGNTGEDTDSVTVS